MPVYLVSTGADDAKVERLVDAANKAQARNHVARETVTVGLAKQAELFRLAKAGKDIEQATPDAPEAEAGAK